MYHLILHVQCVCMLLVAKYSQFSCNSPIPLDPHICWYPKTFQFMNKSPAFAFLKHNMFSSKWQPLIGNAFLYTTITRSLPIFINFIFSCENCGETSFVSYAIIQNPSLPWQPTRGADSGMQGANGVRKRWQSEMAGIKNMKRCDAAMNTWLQARHCTGRLFLTYNLMPATAPCLLASCDRWYNVSHLGLHHRRSTQSAHGYIKTVDLIILPFCTSLVVADLFTHNFSTPCSFHLLTPYPFCALVNWRQTCSHRASAPPYTYNLIAPSFCFWCLGTDIFPHISAHTPHSSVVCGCRPRSYLISVTTLGKNLIFYIVLQVTHMYTPHSWLSLMVVDDAWWLVHAWPMLAIHFYFYFGYNTCGMCFV